MGLRDYVHVLFEEIFGGSLKPTNREELEKESGMITARIYASTWPLNQGRYLTPRELERLMEEAIELTDNYHW